MSHGTLSSVQIDLTSPAYNFATSNPYVNGLLNAGWRWGTSGHTDGSETQVVHYFLDGFTDPNNQIHTALAATTWSTVANISFVSVNNLNDAEIVIHNSTGAAIGHYAGYSGTPSEAVTENTNTTVTDLNNKKIKVTLQLGDLGQVDTYLATDSSDFTSAPSSTDWLPDSAAWIDTIHEVGHALGLKHPHDGGTASSPRWPGVTGQNDIGPQKFNQNIFTIMSYVTPDREFKAFPDSPMAFDIAAIQTLYGANTSFHQGDDTYIVPDATNKWGEDGRAFTCLWDTGGTDQIVYNGTENVVIDLRPATLVNGEGGGGFPSYTYTGTKYGAGFTIAADIRNVLTDVNGVTGVIIENASGGSGFDLLQGNDVDNDLRGNGGRDTIYGHGGNDHLRGNAGKDYLIGGQGNDEYFLDDLYKNKYDGVDETLGGGGDHDIVYVAHFAGGLSSYTLTAGIEIGAITTQDNGFALYGNKLNNELYGNIGNDILRGYGGADIINGGDGDDRLYGGVGNDALDGHNGLDTLRGEADNDDYTLNDLTLGFYDTVIEGANGGTLDTVRIAFIDPAVNAYVLTANVERGFITTATDGFTLIGNASANRLDGNSGEDTLKGEDNNDELYGSLGHDQLWGGLGHDNYTLSDADASGQYDEIHELAGEGVDTVHVRAAFNGSFLVHAYTMADEVEIGIIDDTGGFTLTGNEHRQRL